MFDSGQRRWAAADPHDFMFCHGQGSSWKAAGAGRIAGGVMLPVGSPGLKPRGLLHADLLLSGCSVGCRRGARDEDVFQLYCWYWADVARQVWRRPGRWRCPARTTGSALHELLQFLHIFLFVFWLGPDVAVYIWSRKAVEAGAPPEMQAVSRQMMTRVEMISRASMSLMLTVGGLLSHYVGLEHPWWQMAGIVLLGPVWLLLILVGFFRDGTPFGATALRLETALRWMVIVAVPLSVLWSTLSGRLDVAPYVGAKLLLFAAVLLCWQLLRTGVPRSRTWLTTVWVGLLAAALLGVMKPGVPSAESSVVRLVLPAPMADF